jgi:hypothetical protein
VRFLLLEALTVKRFAGEIALFRDAKHANSVLHLYMF